MGLCACVDKKGRFLKQQPASHSNKKSCSFDGRQAQALDASKVYKRKVFVGTLFTFWLFSCFFLGDCFQAIWTSLFFCWKFPWNVSFSQQIELSVSTDPPRSEEKQTNMMSIGFGRLLVENQFSSWKNLLWSVQQKSCNEKKEIFLKI